MDSRLTSLRRRSTKNSVDTCRMKVSSLSTPTTSPEYVSGDNKPIDAAIRADRTGGDTRIGARLTQGKLMYTNDTRNELSDSNWSWDYQNGFKDTENGSNSNRFCYIVLI